MHLSTPFARAATASRQICQRASNLRRFRAAEGGGFGLVDAMGPWPPRAGLGAEPFQFDPRIRRHRGCSDR
eukprot:8410018-Alexandrium_andersonii.AAC.1